MNNPKSIDAIAEKTLHHPDLPMPVLILRWIAVAFSVYLLLVAVSSISAGFKLASGGAAQAQELLSFASNPFAALVIGILVTSLVQSSSTVTSVIVGMVAGGLPISTAIPMIMGANIGTTVTNTIVSLGHVSEKASFKRAFAAATVHDFFNLFNVLIFLPLEIAFGILEKASAYVALLVTDGLNFNVKDYGFVSSATKGPVKVVKSTLDGWSDVSLGAALIGIGIIVIFFSITLLSKLLKRLLEGKAREVFQSAVGKGPMRGITSGAFITVLVQSSSTTTSLAIPFAGHGALSLRQIYPFTLGANVGTCITALLASMAISGEGATVALQIALVHLFFNLLGVVIIYGIPFLRDLPLRASERLAELASERKTLAISYLLGVFFVVPGSLVWLTQ